MRRWFSIPSVKCFGNGLTIAKELMVGHDVAPSMNRAGLTTKSKPKRESSYSCMILGMMNETWFGEKTNNTTVNKTQETNLAKKTKIYHNNIYFLIFFSK